MERRRLLIASPWVRLDGFLSRFDPDGPAAPMSEEDIVNSIGNDEAVILAGDLARLPGLLKIASRLTVQIHAGAEFLELKDDLLKRWTQAGVAVDLLADRLPGRPELGFLASESRARLVYGQNLFFPLRGENMDWLDRHTPGWKIWFAPKSRPEEALFSTREMSVWRHDHPAREAQLLVYETPFGKPLCSSAPAYFHDLVTDPMDLRSLTPAQGFLARRTLKGIFSSGTTSSFLYAISQKPLVEWPLQALRHGWIVLSSLCAETAALLSHLGREFVFRLVWPVLLYPVRKVFWILEDEIRRRLLKDGASDG